MNVVTLRKMTEKSKLGFGQFQNLTVREILNLHRKPYLRWVYYYLEGLSFTDEILDELGIWGEFRIEKPGVNHELHMQLMARKFMSLSDKEKAHTGRVIKIRQKVRLRKAFRDLPTKSQMQAKNHGR